jgi:hypothetical protein
MRSPTASVGGAALAGDGPALPQGTFSNLNDLGRRRDKEVGVNFTAISVLTIAVAALVLLRAGARGPVSLRILGFKLDHTTLAALLMLLVCVLIYNAAL